MSLANLVNRALSPFGARLMRYSSLYDWQKPGPLPDFRSDPESMVDGLTLDDPELARLIAEYEAFDKSATKSEVWIPNKLSESEFVNFRSDNPYVWQMRGPNMNPLSYLLTFYYVRHLYNGREFDFCDEDGKFGCSYIEIEGKKISRDYLDSLIEIHFLKDNFIPNIEEFRILDIGAGYGRLAHRLKSTPQFSNVRYTCTDGYAVSTHLSRYYLNYRGLGDEVDVISLTEISRYLENHPIDLAINIHSFSECSVETVRWWVNLLRANNVKHIFVVPNRADKSGTIALTNKGENMNEVFYNENYDLKYSNSKYNNNIIQKYGINPSFYFVFSLID